MHRSYHPRSARCRAQSSKLATRVRFPSSARDLAGDPGQIAQQNCGKFEPGDDDPGDVRCARHLVRVVGVLPAPIPAAVWVAARAGCPWSRPPPRRPTARRCPWTPRAAAYRYVLRVSVFDRAVVNADLGRDGASPSTSALHEVEVEFPGTRPDQRLTEPVRGGRTGARRRQRCARADGLARAGAVDPAVSGRPPSRGRPSCGRGSSRRPWRLGSGGRPRSGR